MPEASSSSHNSAVPRHPRAVSMVVCDRIITDMRTGHASLIDLLDELSGAALPLVMPALSLYARLAEAHGSYVLTVDVIRRSDLLEVAHANVGRFEAFDPLEDGEILVHELRVTLPAAGVYDVQLSANGRFVHSMSIRVLG